jgi:hypothetical protein
MRGVSNHGGRPLRRAPQDEGCPRSATLSIRGYDGKATHFCGGIPMVTA